MRVRAKLRRYAERGSQGVLERTSKERPVHTPRDRQNNWGSGEAEGDRYLCVCDVVRPRSMLYSTA